MAEPQAKTDIMKLQEIDISQFVGKQVYVPKKVSATNDDGEKVEYRVDVKKLLKSEEDVVMAEFNNRRIEANAEGQVNFTLSLSEIEAMRKNMIKAAMAKYEFGNDGVGGLPVELYSEFLRVSLEVNPNDMLNPPQPPAAGERAGQGGAAGAPATDASLKNE